VADARSGEVRYSNAGHPKPLVIRREKGLVEPLAIAGRRSQPVLGLFEQAMYQTSVTQLAPHDMIMLFTDGLYEVQDKANELYSQDLLVKGVERRIQLPAAKLFDELLTEVKRFSADGAFSDDVCLVSVELEGDADGAGNSALHRTETAGA
jgi:sigma-B regulation protein RsbU (phosphoserine phosphatase)